MVCGRALVALSAIVVVASASFPKPGSFEYYYPKDLSSASRSTYDTELCYEDGERAIGAPGYPAVPYMPCCSGRPPLPMDKDMKSYTDEKHYGLWCGGTGKVYVGDKCYKDKERAIGAYGYPAVPYMPCCDGREPQSKKGDWGKFCGYPAAPAPKPTVAKEYIPIRCAGEEGYPYVDYVDCGYGYECAKTPKYGWGFFCVPTGDSCYGPGMKGQGAPGYPAITYKPCCDGQKQVEKYGEWGKFCPGKKVIVKKAPEVVYVPYKKPAPSPAPKKYYDPYYPTYPKEDKKPKGPKKTVAPPVTAAPVNPTTAAPVNPTTAAPVNPTTAAPPADLTEVLGEDFGCDTSPAAAPAESTEFDTPPASTSSVTFVLPACGAGGGFLSEEQADALLDALCSVALAIDPAAQCRLVSVPTVRMLLSPVVRQGRTAVCEVGWSTAEPPATFQVAISATFGPAAAADPAPSGTDEA